MNQNQELYNETKELVSRLRDIPDEAKFDQFFNEGVEQGFKRAARLMSHINIEFNKIESQKEPEPKPTPKPSFSRYCNEWAAKSYEKLEMNQMLTIQRRDGSYSAVQIGKLLKVKDDGAFVYEIQKRPRYSRDGDEESDSTWWEGCY